MKNVSFNDGIGSRNIRHMNILVTNGVIVLFEGKDIPGLAKVVKEDYNKNGKWSSSTYEVAVPDDVVSFTFSQDWEMGEYFPCSTWGSAFEKMQSSCKTNILNLDEFKKFIKVHFDDKAKEFGSSEQELSKLSSSSPVFLEWIQARDQFLEAEEEAASVIKEIEQMEETEKLKIQTAVLKEKTAEVKGKLKSGNYVNFANLKAMLN